MKRNFFRAFFTVVCCILSCTAVAAHGWQSPSVRCSTLLLFHRGSRCCSRRQSDLTTRNAELWTAAQRRAHLQIELGVARVLRTAPCVRLVLVGEHRPLSRAFTLGSLGELLWEYPIFMVMGCGVSGSGPAGRRTGRHSVGSAAIWSAHDISASTGGAQLSSLWVE